MKEPKFKMGDLVKYCGHLYFIAQEPYKNDRTYLYYLWNPVSDLEHPSQYVLEPNLTIPEIVGNEGWWYYDHLINKLTEISALFKIVDLHTKKGWSEIKELQQLRDICKEYNQLKGIIK